MKAEKWGLESNKEGWKSKCIVNKVHTETT